MNELNVIFDPAVMETLKQRLTLQLKDVTAREAWDTVLGNYGLRSETDPTTRITRIRRR